MTQEELRELYKERLQREKQGWIAKQTNINQNILSQFKNGRMNLYPHLFEKLEAYLIQNQ
ncbi:MULTISPECIES: hypothetical protein [Clostridium]|uniref:hypothetical protein n=1 Tax=Clostridium TaxID=1485 RepID=UPI000E545527|nr:hypothetical protein [Clostridium fessum]RHP54707.1 hypothetical protein DWZ16_14905 [Clostridium sp. AF29-8BH]